MSRPSYWGTGYHGSNYHGSNYHGPKGETIEVPLGGGFSHLQGKIDEDLLKQIIYIFLLIIYRRY